MTSTAVLHPPSTEKIGFTVHWEQLHGGASALAIANLAQEQDCPVILITENTHTANRFERELHFFAPDLAVALLPDWETLPYDTFSPHQDIISERLAALYQLPSSNNGVLICPITTIMHKLPPRHYLLGGSLLLKVGNRFDIEEQRRQLEKNGYHCVDSVHEHGEYAARGALLDIFPMGSDVPFRIDLLDDEIDSLRSFDPETQRTLEKVEEIRLLPAREYPLDPNSIQQFRNAWHEQFDVDHRRCPLYQDISAAIPSPGAEYYLPLFFDECATLFDFIPDNALIIKLGNLPEAAEQFWQEINHRYEDRRIDPERPLLAPKQIFLSTEELFAEFKQHNMIAIDTPNDGKHASAHNFGCLPPPQLTIDAKQKNPVASLTGYIEEQHRVLLCAESAGRKEIIIDLLKRHDLQPAEVADWRAFLQDKPAFAITIAPLDEGIALNNAEFCLIAESQLFGQRIQQRRRRRKGQDNSDFVIKNLTELTIGSAVAHQEHGVGRYQGLQTIEVDGEQTEFLMLSYADDAKLYVPVASLHLISRFSGADDATAPLHKLGTDQWSKAKRKAAEKVRDVAAELLNVYARREARGGQAFSIDEAAYAAFADGFPFEETPDQASAIAAVLADMASPKAMDRLVCGDVGFGKTEVAMRAAFVAVSNGRQIAVLVPTTLLAQQHYESFKDRFADSAVNIAVLSRFRSAKEQKQTLDELAQGKIDIVIGTHKLLQADVQYKNLGLLIIDEEHRFGVRQKEQLKALRAEVDILTLTATPIPRTLNMSMSGMRDLSIITTPPARRLSIKTFVRQHQAALIKEAIQREIMRGGQVYYLHNEVKSIEKTADDLKKLMPSVRVAIAHGQMRESELEQIMSDFYHKRFNVLVCTTIIETGIDVPNANTIIMDRADKLGLAQLHQLRGRVGRSHHQAYAYLLTGDPKSLSKDAEKRLEAISMSEELGSGFTLATHDLEIRGAGELLGDEQSGQIQTIGFSLYMEMLERAVKAIKNGQPLSDELFETSSDINFNLAALIPDDYLPDVNTRLILYKRIANADNDDALRDLQVEMIDRFGLLPPQVKNLFRVTSIKLLAQQLGIRKLDVGVSGGKIEFAETTSIEPVALIDLIQRKPATYKLAGASALSFNEELQEAEQRFNFVESLLDNLSPKTQAATA